MVRPPPPGGLACVSSPAAATAVEVVCCLPEARAEANISARGRRSRPLGGRNGLWPLLDGHGPRFWSLAIAAAVLGVALFAPHLLRPFNRLWFRFGMLLHKVVTPVLMGVVFFLTVVPTGLIFRLFGKDLLRLRCDNDAETYWIDREPRGPEPDTMPNQF